MIKTALVALAMTLTYVGSISRAVALQAAPIDVKEAEGQWRQAIRTMDADALDRLLGDNYLFIAIKLSCGENWP